MSDELLQQYSTILEQLATQPFNRELYIERIQLAKELGLADEVENGRIDWADHFPLSEGESCTLSLSLPPCHSKLIQGMT